ncbi:MAG: hypothetical protein AB7E72_05500 [Lysobacterales bacterium]
MQRIFDRRTQRTLGLIDEVEFASFRSLFQSSISDDELPSIDPAAMERLYEAGASDNLRFIVRQVLDGCDDLDLGWAPAESD